jgi:hypothetical protein
MVSLGTNRETLRLHLGFAAAPDVVLHAVGRLFTRGTAGEHEAARQTIREYLGTLPPVPVQPRRRPHQADQSHLLNLRAEFDRVNARYFADELPDIPLYLSDRMRRRNGHFSVSPLEIVISRRLCTSAAPDEAESTLRHEMIHLWQHVNGRSPDHGMEFRRWAQVLKVHPRATRMVCWRA